MYRTFVALAFAAVNTLAAADVAGAWTGLIDTKGAKAPIVLRLTVTGDKVSGTVSTRDLEKASPIENAKLSGDELSFEARDRTDQLVQYHLKVSTDRLSGESRTGNDIATVSLTRVTANAPRPTGASTIGGGVTPPAIIRKFEPSYTEEARAAKLQGSVVLYVEVDPTGVAKNISVLKSLGLGLDQEAIKTVQQWKFKPGEKDGRPVTVAANIEVNFRLM
jgi:TonB family protein